MERISMLLENKNAVIYGAGGAIGGAVASTFAREEANVHLRWPRRSAPLEDVGKVAAFAASDHARTMTATAISCGAIVD
jgi:NAD(P)-dependent dehydrogenase (short-subunit alcohol dehydrogenase family)